MLILFYITSVLFIWSNLYYIINYKRFDMPFSERVVNKKIDILYFTSKGLFWIWILAGIFTPVKNIIYLILLFTLIKFIIFHFNNKLYSFLFKMTPPLIIILMIIILSKVFIN